MPKRPRNLTAKKARKLAVEAPLGKRAWHLSQLGVTPAMSMAAIAKKLGLGSKVARKLVVRPPTEKQLAHRERFKRMVASGEMAALRAAKAGGARLVREPVARIGREAMDEEGLVGRGRKRRGGEGYGEGVRGSVADNTIPFWGPLVSGNMHRPIGGGGV